MTVDDSNLITETEFILNMFQKFFNKIFNDKYALRISDKYINIMYETVELEIKKTRLGQKPSHNQLIKNITKLQNRIT